MNMSGVRMNRFQFFWYACLVLRLSGGESFIYFLHVVGAIKTNTCRIGREFWNETRLFGVKIKTVRWSGDEKQWY